MSWWKKAGRVASYASDLHDRYSPLAEDTREELMDADVSGLARDAAGTAKGWLGGKIAAKTAEFDPSGRLFDKAWNWAAPKVESGLSKAWNWFKSKTGLGGSKAVHFTPPEATNLKNMTGAGVGRDEFMENATGGPMNGGGAPAELESRDRVDV